MLSMKRRNTMRRRSIYSINFEYDEKTEDDYEGEGETKAKYFFFIIEGINTITERVSLAGRKDGKFSFCRTNNKNSENSATNNNINIPNVSISMNHDSGIHNYSNTDNSIVIQEDKKKWLILIVTKINNSSQSNKTIVGNVSRFNAHFPQLSKSTFLDPQRNLSSKPGLTTMLKNASSEAI